MDAQRTLDIFSLAVKEHEAARPNGHFSVLLWTTEGVMQRARERDLAISHHQADDIVKQIHQDHRARHVLMGGVIDAHLNRMEVIGR